MFCVQCGKQIPDDSKICCYCGVAATRTVAAPVEQTPEPVVPQPNPAPVVEQKPAPAAPKKKLWLMLGGIAAALILVILAVVLFSGGDKVDLWVLEKVYAENGDLGGLGQYCTYDAQGNMTERGDRMAYVFVGGAFNTETYTYNEKGDCVQLVNAYEGLNERGSINISPVTTEYSYTYEDGRKTERYVNTDAGKRLIESYHYNGDMLSESIYYDEEGAESLRKTFDRSGRLVRVLTDNLQEKYSYDNKGRLLQIQVYERYDLDEEYELYQEVTLHYDARGCLTKAVFDNGIDNATLEYTTDSHGNITETVQGGSITTFEYKKIRVSREQALKLVGEYYDSLFYIYKNRYTPLFYYRIEE